jgi:DNA polymerase III epsilon subunit-like protein
MSRVTRSAPLIFLDTETTGLHKARRPWEIALIKRADSGQTRLLLCVDVRDLVLEDADPVGLRISGFHRRHPQARDRPLLIPRVYRAGDASALVHEWTAGATIVGVVPRFDAECLADMFARHGIKPAWNDDLVDVVPLATAAMRAARREPASDVASLSRQCGVKPPAAAHRHTALGDARWAMRWYDKLVQL